jgi:aspartyl-tRNA(Asn)/glutamyl-tRNA(Gln) amidotransferase subunit A
MEPGVEAAVRAAVDELRSAGAEIVDVSLPHTDYGLATYYIIAPAEASANLARYDGIRYGLSVREGDVLGDYLATRGRGFGAEVKRRIMLGTYALSAGYYDAYYIKAQKVRTLIKGDFDRAFESVDALVAPTSPTVAFPMGARLEDPVAMYLSDACTLPVNVAGLPGISVPCGLSEGLPVGLQFIGRAWDEAGLFRVARAYEGITASAEWRSLEPTDLARLDDPAEPTPAERLGRATGVASVRG